MDTWQFYQNEAGLWCWKHTAQGGESAESERCFESRTDCIANAMRHGYLARADLHSIPAAQRRFAIAWRSTFARGTQPGAAAQLQAERAATVT